MAREKLDYSQTVQMIRDAGGEFELDGKIYTEADLFTDPTLLPRAHAALNSSAGEDPGRKTRKEVTPRPCWIGLVSSDGQIISEAETFYNQRLDRDGHVARLQGLSILAPGSRVLLAVEDTEKREVTIEGFSLADLRALFQG